MFARASRGFALKGQWKMNDCKTEESMSTKFDKLEKNDTMLALSVDGFDKVVKMKV